MYNIHGHPRSGTHYLMAVLNANFVHKPSIWEVEWGHLKEDSRGRKVMAYPLHGLPETFRENSLPHFYIWRDFEDVARSILRMPDRFCMTNEELTLEEFTRTPWGELHVPGTRWAWKVDGEKKTGTVSAFAGAMPPPDMTPYEYWHHHVSRWCNFASDRSDVCLVEYATLTSDFQDEMKRITKWLGMGSREFMNVKEKVGGQPL